MTTIEQVRQYIGLSKPQMANALGIRRGRTSPFRAQQDSDVDPILTDHATSLLRQYQQWRSSVLSQVIQHRTVSLAELARILGTNRHALYQAKQRGAFFVTQINGKRDAQINSQTLHRLFDQCEHPSTTPTIRALIARAFLTSLNEPTQITNSQRMTA